MRERKRKSDIKMKSGEIELEGARKEKRDRASGCFFYSMIQ